MADLTGQDINNYDKLKEALNNTATTNDNITTKIKARIQKTGSVKNTEELSAIVNPLYSYWKILSDLETPLKFTEAKFEQQFSDSIENLKRSLDVLEDEKIDLTDEIEEFQPDVLFLKFIKEAELPIPPSPSAKTSTEKLINDIDPHLSESQIAYLTNTWETAVNKFVKDARRAGGSVNPGQPETFASFFRIHKELEILYSRLADTETVQLSR